MTLWDSDFERDHDDVYDLATARADLDRKRAREGRALTEPEQGAGSSAHRPETASAPGSVNVQENGPWALIPGADPGACPDCGQYRKAGIPHECVSTNPLLDQAVLLAELQWPGATLPIARTPLGDRLHEREAQ